MTAYQLVSTMEAARTSWRLSTAHTLNKRQLLFIADILRARLLNDRRERSPTLFENSAQELPLLTPVRSTSTFFGIGVPTMEVGPIPQPIDALEGPAFTFVGVPSREKLSIVSATGVYYRNFSRQNAGRACAMWMPATRKLVFNEELQPLTPKRRIQYVALHPMEVHLYQPAGSPLKLVANPFDFEYPLPGSLVQILLEMAARHEQLTSLLPADLDNDDIPAQPSPAK